MIFVKGISYLISYIKVLGVSCVRKSTNWKVVALVFGLTFPLLKKSKPEDVPLKILSYKYFLGYMNTLTLCHSFHS